MENKNLSAFNMQKFNVGGKRVMKIWILEKNTDEQWFEPKIFQMAESAEDSAKKDIKSVIEKYFGTEEKCSEYCFNIKHGVGTAAIRDRGGSYWDWRITEHSLEIIGENYENQHQ